MRASIRKFTLLGVCLGTVLLFAVYIAVQSRLLRATFTDFADQSLAADVVRAKNGMEEEVHKLDDVVVDWAVWDDSALFMQGKMRHYEASNLNDKTLDTLRLSLIAFINNQGTVVWSRQILDNGATSRQIPEDMRGIIFKQSAMLAATTQEERVHGIASLQDGMAIVASCPILDSEGKGPKQGTLVMARQLTPETQEKIADTIRLRLQLEKAATPLPPALRQAARPRTITEGEDDIVIYDIGDNALAGLDLIPDILNARTLRLIVFGDKEIVRRGIEVSRRASAILALGGLGLLGAIVFLIEWRVLRRILGIRSQLNRIGAGERQGELLEQVRLTGDDEISALADQVNRFIDAINNYKTNLEQLVQDKTRDLHQEIFKKQEIQDELEIAKEAAERANRTKSDFLAKVTHEIRTPMNAIKGMNDYLMQAPLTAEQLECHTVIRDSSAHLLTIVNDLLDLSKIEAGQLSLEHIDFNLHRLVGSTIKILKPLADGKRIGLYVDYAGDPGAVVNSDPSRIRQILFNLAHNAIKFTKIGEVRIRIALAPDETGNGYTAAFSVKDTGVGIPAEALDRIFEPFVQSDDSTSRRFGGTGLGLAICRQLAAMLGGTLQVSSVPGVGSEFSFRLTLGKGCAETLVEEEAGDKPAAMEQLQILVVDDNPINLKVAEKLFSLLDQKPVFAGNGREALELLKTNLFDVVFLDIEMPDMNGFEVTRIIRQGKDTALNQKTPIIAMTAYSLDSVKQRCLQAGMNDFITKPLDIDILFTRLQPFTHHSIIVCADAAGTGAHRAPAVGAAGADLHPVLDADAALDRLGQDRDLYVDICIGFLEKFNAERFAILYLQHEPDLTHLAIFIHSLKGMARQVGAERIGFQADALERLLAEGGTEGDREALRQRLLALKEEIARAEAALGAYLLG